MAFFCNINVGYINICVEKNEETDFNFVNPSRFGDGFVCFTSGEGQLIFDGEPPIKISAGTFVRFSKGESYEFHVNGPCSYITSEMELEYSEYFPRVVVLADNEISFLRRICARFAEKNRLCIMETKIMLLNFLVSIDEKSYGEKTLTSHVVNMSLDYIHRNYNRNFTIEEMADECHVSASYLMQGFKREEGMSVMAYREKLRIKNAKDMLRSGAFRVKEVADLLGYCDVYHFSKRFKEATGKTPAAYAKLQYEE